VIGIQARFQDVMKLLPNVLAIAALSMACKKDKEAAPPMPTAEQGAPAPSPTPPAAPAPTQPPAPAPSTPTKLGPSGLPVECDDYKAAIDKLASCPKLAPDAKDSLVQAYQAASAGWTKLPEDSRKNLASTCKAAVDAVNAAAKTQCGW
jgi:hypothetical protein